MKKFKLLSFFIICTTIIFAQSSSTTPKEHFIGLGEFHFGMTMDEVRKTIKIHTSDSSAVSLLNDVTLEVTNITLAGYVFDYCDLSFKENQLCIITFYKYFAKEDNDPIGFHEIMNILQNDYGQPIEEIIKKNKVYSWQSDSYEHILLSKSYNKKKEKTVICILGAKF